VQCQCNVNIALIDSPFCQIVKLPVPLVVAGPACGPGVHRPHDAGVRLSVPHRICIRSNNIVQLHAFFNQFSQFSKLDVVFI
jgi:hypothetical protein